MSRRDEHSEFGMTANRILFALAYLDPRRGFVPLRDLLPRCLDRKWEYVKMAEQAELDGRPWTAEEFRDLFWWVRGNSWHEGGCMSPQCEALIDYLTRHGSVTPLEALSELGIGRLSARVLELKRSGFGIVTTIVEVPTRAGVAHVARYSLGTSSDGVRADSQSAALREQPPSFS